MFRRLSLILKIMGKLFEYPEAKSVVVCGDIHGDFHTLANKMCKQYQMTDTLLIVAGDCGFGFDKPAYYEQVYNKDAGISAIAIAELGSSILHSS